MKFNIEILKTWTFEDASASPDKLFVYNDNDERDNDFNDILNTIGIRTKKKSSTHKSAYYTDEDFEENKTKIIEDIDNIKWEMLCGKKIVFSTSGYGNGENKLEEKAPHTYKFLCDVLLREFGFLNKDGRKFVRFPNYNEIISAKTLPMNYEHGKLGYGQNKPGKFRDELLERGITNTYDAIKFGLRTGTTRGDKNFVAGEVVKFSKTGESDLLLCRVTRGSYPVKDISVKLWSKIEGWTEDYFNDNPEALDKYQFQFEFIGLVGKDDCKLRLLENEY